jgi:membrane protease YdiL (CAAX protease family)
MLCPMGAPCGWYPDPWRASPARWWDGLRWTALVGQSVGAPPAWYADPSRQSPFRWWDGATWTDQTAPPEAPPAEPDPTFSFTGGLWGLAGVAFFVVFAQVVAAVLADHLRVSPAVAIAAFYLPAYGGIAATCVLVSRRFGSGSLVADYGWRVRGTDVWRALLVWVCGGIAAAIASLPWLHDDPTQRVGRSLRHGYHHLGAVAVIEFAFVAIVLAPLIEELAFRGLLLRAFSQRVAVPWAIAIQAALFGAYHFTPGLGRANQPGVVVRAAIGVVLGTAAARWKRLGPTTIGHMIFNTLFVISVVAAS